MIGNRISLSLFNCYVAKRIPGFDGQPGRAKIGLGNPPQWVQKRMYY
jgi:hypothetical protein